jgi:hypothetical protein
VEPLPVRSGKKEVGDTPEPLELVDLKDCMACSRVCGERFSHLTMTTTAKGFKGQFVCMDREACHQRQLSGGGAMERARKAARR